MNVAVVGAGVIGCAVAYECASRGADVSVFERRGVARGASWASAGVLAPWIEVHERGSLLDICAESLAMYDAFVERVRSEGVPTFEYARTGTLEAALTHDQADALQRTAGALVAAGVRAQWLSSNDARALEPALPASINGALHISEHGFVEMPGFVGALSVAARQRGAVFHEPADVTKIEPASGGQVRLHTSGDARLFDHIVIAGGSWSNRLTGAHRVVKPIKGQLLRLRFDAPPASRVLWSEGCYMVSWQDGTLLVGATMEDVGFDERTTSAAIERLLSAAAELLPVTRDAVFVEARAGLRPAPADGDLPRIGPSDTMANVTIAAGHFRNGVLLTPLTAARVAQQLGL